MRAQSPVGLAMSWPPLALTFLVDVGIIVLVSNWPTEWRRDIAWWTGIGIVAALTMLVLITVRGVPLGVVLARWVRNFFTNPETQLTAGREPAIDHRRRFGHATVGIREHRGALVAVVALVAPVASGAGGRHSQPQSSMTELPIRAVADGLRQFDVHLDWIDVISTTAAGSPPAERGPDAWLVLRMTPTDNVGSVIVRDSVASTIAAVAERIADDMARRGFDAWPLTADEIGELDEVVLAGLRPEASKPRLRFLAQHDDDGDVDGYVTSFWLSPKDIDTDALTELWEVDAEATVIALRLLTRHNQVEVSAWVRFHTAERLEKSVWKGLNRLTGRQLRAVTDSLPVPARQPRLKLPARPLGDDDTAALPLPQPASGQVEASS
ncbi:type VII secretion protein EccE [Mycolicibacillus trivialis]